MASRRIRRLIGSRYERKRIKLETIQRRNSWHGDRDHCRGRRHHGVYLCLPDVQKEEGLTPPGHGEHTAGHPCWPAASPGRNSCRGISRKYRSERQKQKGDPVFVHSECITRHQGDLRKTTTRKRGDIM